MNPVTQDMSDMNTCQDWFTTASGGRFFPFAPKAEDIHIEDIAHALSHICRFGGHCRQFYSVAQHSVLVSKIVPPQHALAGLLHDATEAYVGDMVRPLKRRLPDYNAIEASIWAVIAGKFSVPIELPFEVKYADNVALVTEMRDLVVKVPWKCRVQELGLEPDRCDIMPWEPGFASWCFLRRFEELTRKP